MDKKYEKIIHISVDEKFLNSAYIQFNELPFKNEFYVLTNNSLEDLKYVTPQLGVNAVQPSIKNLKEIQTKAENSIVFFHGLFTRVALQALFIKKNTSSLKFWMSWGGEFYNNSDIFKKNNQEFLGEKTYKLNLQLTKKERFLNFFKQKIVKIVEVIRLKTFKNLNQLITTQAMRSMDFIVLPFKEEKQFIEQKLERKYNFLKFSYYPIDSFIIDKNTKVEGCNILIGNSASASNNHLEVFDKIKNINLANRKIYCPLSYGSKTYANVIIREGKQYFGEKFKPLTSFMPLAEYNKVLMNCGVVIMGHYRQQAFGNIISLVYAGSKVFLSKKNTIFQYLKRINVYIYSIEEDLTPDNLQLLDSEKQEYNRTLMLKEYNKDTLKVELESCLSELVQQNEC